MKVKKNHYIEQTEWTAHYTVEEQVETDLVRKYSAEEGVLYGNCPLRARLLAAIAADAAAIFI
jgi:hypothetical protein